MRILEPKWLQIKYQVWDVKQNLWTNGSV
jgi:hypothetical protein